MRALAHPARLEILDHLSLIKDGATATECAELVGLSPSATSYHLRALAKVGMIQEAPSRGDGRERVWQVSFRNYAVGAERDAGAEEIAAEAAIVEAFLARQNERVRRYQTKARAEKDEFFDVATMTEQTLMVTAAELKELLTKLDELIAPLKRRDREEPPEDSRAVSMQIRAIPIV
ncbi:transcriptional regulator [Rhizocola hellebori]|uniref:Transcriptional regulator n=2 Tax=Rhizocola hellebori TaxID=1392758 RepID=A0A8J3VLC6_9ACTN|nr:transcriptional regulator [Rhizocola hellebori]